MNINIFNCNPNKTYILTNKNFKGNILEYELLTDGDIRKFQSVKKSKSITYVSKSSDANDGFIILAKNHSVNITLKDASYAIMQCLNNDQIMYLEIFTNITDLEKVKQIIEIGNKVYDKSDNLLTHEKPYVRKLTLK